MSCQYYDVGRNHFAKFSDVDDSTSCLCTLDLMEDDPVIRDDQLKSLAMLGAACLYINQLPEEEKVELCGSTIQGILPLEVLDQLTKAFPIERETNE